jgi:hypothetical protein
MEDVYAISASDIGYLGSGQKWAVTLTCEGFSMNEDDWKIIITCGNKVLEFTKENSVQDENGQWYIAVDTSKLSPGKAIITCVAYVPDEDFENGVRTEILERGLINIKSLQTPADVTYHE